MNKEQIKNTGRTLIRSVFSLLKLGNIWVQLALILYDIVFYAVIVPILKRAKTRAVKDTRIMVLDKIHQESQKVREQSGFLESLKHENKERAKLRKQLKDA